MITQTAPISRPDVIFGTDRRLFYLLRAYNRSFKVERLTKELTAVSGNNFIVHLQVPIEGSRDNFISPSRSYVVFEQRTYGSFRDQLYCSSTPISPGGLARRTPRPVPRCDLTTTGDRA